MIPKVGQLLRWYDNTVRTYSTSPHNDIGIVKAVEFEGVNFFDNDEYAYVVIVDWCKGPHHSIHDQQEWEESIHTNEIVPVQ
jgi:hypothetical protein